jgi:hypothetical protein
MSKVFSHAELEFKAMGWLNEDGTWCDDMQELICNQVLELIDLFGTHGHSGSSAPYAADMFKKLAMYEPLGPLTGEDWEWNELDYGGDIKYQNKRCGHVFKGADGRAYDSEGKIFYDWYTNDAGERYKSHFTSKDSRVYIEFPYTPTREYVEADPSR